MLLRHRLLRPACLPIPPPGRTVEGVKDTSVCGGASTELGLAEGPGPTGFRPVQTSFVSPACAGVVLAGGRSSRMGTNKALLEVDGISLWRRQWAVLASAGIGPLCLSVAQAGSWAPPEVPTVVDGMRDQGPIAGLQAALAWNRNPLLAALAVDLPFLPPAWFRQLLQRCRDGGGAVGQREDGTFEPLAAVYPACFASRVEAATAAGQRRMQPLLHEAVSAGEMVVEPISEEREFWFRNWNRPEDLA